MGILPKAIISAALLALVLVLFCLSIAGITVHVMLAGGVGAKAI